MMHSSTSAPVRPEAPDALGALSAFEAEALAALEDLSSTAGVPLSPGDVIAVSEGWNKALAWRDAVMEAFSARWRLLVAAADSKLPGARSDADPVACAFTGRAGDLPDLLCGVLDCAVRALAPEREHIARESYRALHPDPRRPCQDLEGYALLFADLGVRPRWWVHAQEAFCWALETHVPYMEGTDRSALSQGWRHSAFGRFFARRVARPIIEAARRFRASLTAPALERARAHVTHILVDDDARALAGQTFYRNLLDAHPELLDYFESADMDALAFHLIQALELLVHGIPTIGEYGAPLRGILEHLGEMHRRLMVPSWAYPLIGAQLIELLALPGEDETRAFAGIYRHVATIMAEPITREERLIADAEAWFRQLADEWQWSPAQLERRLLEVRLEVSSSGTYTHTSEEIEHGARVAWRNSAKCIGRISWSTLVVRDRRHVTDPDTMFAECLEHLDLATGGTNLLAVMTVFRPRRPDEQWGPRFWTSQFVRYAGYRRPDGGVLGDPANAEFTAFLIERGLWTPPPDRGAFDVLPLALSMPDAPEPYVYELPRAYVHECPISHPNHPAVAALGLRWCAVPAITNFELVLGGVRYACCPFNGWFLELEVVRNLMERYDVAEPFAAACGISTDERLWKNRVFHELSVAVLHSFEAARMTMVDQFTASDSFFTHCQRERDAGRECPAQWSWIGGLLGPNHGVWHHETRDFTLEPQYHYCAEHWLTGALAHDEPVARPPIGKPAKAVEVAPPPTADVQRPRVLLLFGSETGTAEAAARRCAAKLRLLRPTIAPLDDYAKGQKRQEIPRCFTHVLVVSSTFGKGQAPTNARHFLGAEPLPALDAVTFGVLGLGSSIYPDFCRFAVRLDEALAAAGGRRLFALTKADEARGASAVITDWIAMVRRALLPGSLERALEAARANALSREPAPPTFTLKWSPPSAPISAADALAIDLPATDGDMALARCTLNDELLDGGDVGSRSTRHLAFELPEGMTYESGDHLAVRPLNPTDMVLRLAERLGCAEHLGSTFEVMVDDNGDVYPAFLAFRTPATLAEVLRRQVDLKAHDAHLVALLGLVRDGLPDGADGGHDELDAWLRCLESPLVPAAEREAVSNIVIDRYPTVLDLLDGFPDARVDAAALLPLLQRLSPRYYSISSSAAEHPKSAHATVGVLHTRTPAGAAIHGVCSNYLANLAVGDEVLLTVRTSAFRAPAAPTDPVIFIGPGTGLAPIVALVADRRLQHDAGEALGPCHVFFGCRTRRDRLYADVLDPLADGPSPVISRLHLALSREPGHPRVYVQDLMKAAGDEMAELLCDPRTHLYVCGDARMADGCFEAAVELLCAHAGKSRVAAVHHLQVMRMEDRWQLDVWGIISHFSESRETIRSRKRQAARVWMKRFATAQPDMP